jgi:DNA-binding SARP family transcriptional activator
VLVFEGVVVRPKIRKSLELLSFLASRPGSTATRAEVLTGLWNGRDDDSTRAYLRQALRHLRDALPAGITVTNRDDRLRIEGAVSTESGEVAALLAEAARHLGERRHALLFDAYAIVSRGLFLDGSDDVAWVDDCRARQRSTLADVRLDLADHLVGEERYLDALSYIDEALADDAILERGWRLRMQALAMLGDSDGVLVAFRRCRAALAELDLEPSRATIDLVRALRS